MGRRAEAHLVYGVIVEGNYDEDIDNRIYASDDFEYMSCGHPDANERFVIYDPRWHYSVEWDETYKLRFSDLEVDCDLIKLIKLARSVGCEDPDPGWHLVAYYG